MCVQSSQFIRWSLWISGGKSNTASDSVAISFTCNATWPHFVSLLALTVSRPEKHVPVIQTYLCMRACMRVCVCVCVLRGTKQGHLSICIAILVNHFSLNGRIELCFRIARMNNAERQTEGEGDQVYFVHSGLLYSMSLGNFRMVIRLKIIHLYSRLSSFLKSQGVKLAITFASLSHRKVLRVCCGLLPVHMRLHSDALKCPNNTLFESEIKWQRKIQNSSDFCFIFLQSLFLHSLQM